MQRDSFRSPDGLFFRSLFEQSADAMIVLDDSESVVLMNRAARELQGVDVGALFRGTASRPLAPFLDRLRVGLRSSVEHHVVTTDGCTRRLELEGRRDGSHTVIVFRDVTERRTLEEELQQLRRVESIGHLTASVVHDFNNLLAVIGASSAVLARETEDRALVLELAHEIQAATERAATLVGQLLSRIRQRPPVRESLNAGNVVAEMRPLLERLVGDEVEVSLLLDAELGETIVDREAFERALLNLAANARDAMQKGGRLTITACNVILGENGVVAKNVPADGRYVALTVSDTGAGMSREVRERIFEPFFTTKGPAHGTGLGLAMVRRFAMQSGGCVSAHSAPGVGTTIVLYLPNCSARTAVA